MPAVQLKDPGAVLDWSFDYNDTTDPYLASGETLSTSTWAVVPTGELVIDSDSETTTVTTVFLSAGTRGGVYRVTNTVTTSGSRTEQRTLTVRVDDR